MLVRCVSVEDDVNQLARRDLCLHGVEKADELVMATKAAVHALTLEPIQAYDQRHRRRPFLVIGLGSGPALFHRARQAQVERQDLPHFADRQEDGMARWGDIKVDALVQVINTSDPWRA